jgi:hypothetical protein
LVWGMKPSGHGNSSENGSHRSPLISSEFLPTGGKNFQYFCSYCHVDITQYLRIYCNECSNFLLCADCYCAGVELFPHQASHSYRIVDCLHIPIFTKDWTIGEELLLLEGIEKHGIGNWKTISDYIGTKTARACGDHYWNDYLGRFGSCLPPQTLIPEQQSQVLLLPPPLPPFSSSSLSPRPSRWRVLTFSSQMHPLRPLL